MFNERTNPMLMNRELANQYAERLDWEDRQRNVNATNNTLSAVLREDPDIYDILEPYGIPTIILRTITRRIINFTIENAGTVTGSLPRRVNALYNRFVQEEREVIFILRLFGVPVRVIQQFIRRVIRIVLIIIGDTVPDLGREVNRILRLFEARFPNFLGLINIYNIPRVVARNITRDIIRFTLENINRISPVGTIPERSLEMLRLLDAEQPELIERMITGGVPAARAEEITRRIIAFTIRNANL